MTALSVSLLVDLSRILSDAVAPSLGPAGCDALMRSQSGAAILTNSGAAILQNLTVKHPILRVMLNTIKRHADIYGDGSTSMYAVKRAAALEAKV